MDDSKIRAIASVSIGDAFAIHGITVIDSEKGSFVQMPQVSYVKNGKTGYSALLHSISAGSRCELYNKILSAYKQKLQSVSIAHKGKSKGRKIS